MALASMMQDDFSAGIYRGRKAPPNAVYDAVNALIDDEGLLFKRGGSAYQTTSDAAGAILGIGNVSTAAGRRTLVWDSTRFQILNATDDGLTTIYTPSGSVNPPAPLARVAGSGEFALLPYVSAAGVPRTGIVIYAGSRKTANWSSIANLVFTNGSTTVTRAAGGFSANVDAGMIIQKVGPPTEYAVVGSVGSDTSLTLTKPWAGASSTDGGNFLRVHFASSAAVPNNGFVTSAGTRVIVASGHTVGFSSRGGFEFGADEYHELPVTATIRGADSLGDSALIFTAEGIWSISNLVLDAVDAFGNVQHSVTQLDQNVILWGDSGIARTSGGLVVPALDDVYFVRLDVAPGALSASIRPLYRSYVKAGYRPGTAAVHRGHYILPILDGTTWVDTLVCRLDRDAAWTRWSGHAGALAYSVRIEQSAAPKLLSSGGLRVLDLTGAFDPASDNAADADASIADCTIITRDYPLGQQPGNVRRVRLRYELAEQATADTFERADEFSLAPPWLAWANTMPKLVSGAVYSDSGRSDATRPEVIGPDCFCQAVFDGAVTAGNGENFGVGVRLTAHGPADGYMFELADVGTGYRPRLYRGTAFTTIATGSTVTAGAITGIRITAIGTTITGHFLIDGVWTSVVSTTDATYSAAGYPGFWVDDMVAFDLGVEEVSWSATLPAVGVEFSSDQDGGEFAELDDRGEQGGAAGWGVSAGDKYNWASVGKTRERIRYRITVAGAAASFVLRTVEQLFRASGRQ